MVTTATHQSVIHFSRGVPPLEAIPTRELADHAIAAVREVPGAMFQYAPLGQYQGDPALREEIASFHGFEANQIFVSNGALQVLDLLASHLLRNGNHNVYVEAPTYDRAVQIFQRHGGQVRGIPMEEDGIDLNALAKYCLTCSPAFVYTIPDFQNPSGITMSEAKRQAFVSLASRFHFTIIEDIPYRELRYRGVSPPLIAKTPAGVSDIARVITVGSLTKILSPGLRVGYAVSDPETSRQLATLAEGTYLSPSPLCQAIAARCMKASVVHANIERVRQLLKPRHDHAVTAARRLLGNALLSVPDGGYFLSAHLRVHTDEATFVAAAKKEGLVLTRGSAFYPPSSAPPAGTLFLRLPFQALDPEDFALGLERLVAIADGK
jgi:2-aminoadipate transaminase